MPELMLEWPLWLRSVVLFAAALLGGFLLRLLIQRWVSWYTPRDGGVLAKSLGEQAAAPLGWVLSIALFYAVLPWALPEPWLSQTRHGTWIALVLALAWFVGRLLTAAEEVITGRLGIDHSDNLRARKLQTQLKVIRQMAVVLVLFLAGVVILMSFEHLRDLGTGLLASAGIAGIVLGLAAQRTLSNLIAGFLIAFTQPIRLDDVLVVEGEWGRVEEITLHYVVIRIWDLRRLIVPISHFLDQPFENWTRTQAKVLGAVTLHLDYRVPVDEIRRETERLVHGHRDWDGDVCGVQVTGTTASAVEVRLLISARDSGTAWNLRCELRERIIAWLAAHHPDALPRVRASVDPPPEPTTDLVRSRA